MIVVRAPAASHLSAGEGRHNLQFARQSAHLSRWTADLEPNGPPGLGPLAEERLTGAGPRVLGILRSCRTCGGESRARRGEIEGDVVVGRIELGEGLLLSRQKVASLGRPVLLQLANSEDPEMKCHGSKGSKRST